MAHLFPAAQPAAAPPPMPPPRNRQPAQEAVLPAEPSGRASLLSTNKTQSMSGELLHVMVLTWSWSSSTYGGMHESLDASHVACMQQHCKLACKLRVCSGRRYLGVSGTTTSQLPDHRAEALITLLSCACRAPQQGRARVGQRQRGGSAVAVRPRAAAAAAGGGARAPGGSRALCQRPGRVGAMLPPPAQQMLLPSVWPE